jgi:hypothetical protein
MESYECNGYWWVPENPDNKVYGTLKFFPTEGYVLDTMGIFLQNKSNEINKRYFKELKKTEIILGLTDEGKLITLYDCLNSKIRERTSKYHISFIFVGFHFEKKEHVQFKSVTVNYSHLSEWIYISGIEFETVFDPKGKLIDKKIHYNLPSEIMLDLKDFCLKFRWDLHGDFTPEAYGFKEKIYVIIEAQKSISFHHFLNICLQIQNFLSLGLRKATSFLITDGKNEKYYSQNHFTGETIYWNIKIFSSEKNENDNNLISSDRMLFSYRDIESYLENCLNNWFIKAKDLEPVYNLYFGTMYNPHMYLQQKFLSLITALESYHRRIHGGQYFEDIEEFKIVYKKMLESIELINNNDFKDKMKTNLEHANEYALKKRLKLIIKVFGSKGINIKLSKHDKERLITDLGDIRNELTHYSKKSDYKSKDYDKMFEYVEIMERFIEMCFLLELEIPKEKIIELFNKNSSLNIFTLNNL